MWWKRQIYLLNTLKIFWSIYNDVKRVHFYTLKFCHELILWSLWTLIMIAYKNKFSTYRFTTFLLEFSNTSQYWPYILLPEWRKQLNLEPGYYLHMRGKLLLVPSIIQRRSLNLLLQSQKKEKIMDKVYKLF